MRISIGTTLEMISYKINIPKFPLIVCTDSYSLYECLVKLGSTSEKRLMIDIMHLRQLYEPRDISQIRWIHGDDNLADSITNPGLTKLLKP